MRSNPFPFSLRQFQYAVAVADRLSFGRAAASCHVSQPALSVQIARLEKGLGIRMFERDRRRVIVTAAGRSFVERARAVLLEIEGVVEAARQSADPLGGVLRAGVIPTISPYLLPRVTSAIRRAHPQLTLLWTEDKTGVLLASLREGTLDAALLAIEAGIGDVDREILGRDDFVLACPVSHPLAVRKSPVRPEDLRDVDVLLLDEGHCFRAPSLSYCTRARAKELEFRGTSLSTLAQMVAGGAGVTLLPRLALATELQRAELHIRSFAAPTPGRTLALVWRKRSPLGPALRRLAATMRTVGWELDGARQRTTGIPSSTTPPGGRPR